MKAKDMFWQIGYMEILNEEYNYVDYTCTMYDEEYGYYLKDIVFYLDDERIEISLDTDEEPTELRIDELQCIMKKIEELGWKKYEFRQSN